MIRSTGGNWEPAAVNVNQETLLQNVPFYFFSFFSFSFYVCFGVGVGIPSIINKLVIIRTGRLQNKHVGTAIWVWWLVNRFLHSFTTGPISPRTIDNLGRCLNEINARRCGQCAWFIDGEIGVWSQPKHLYLVDSGL